MSVFKELSSGIADLSELNVQTFTGSLESVVNESAGGSVIDWPKLMAQAKTTGKVRLVASTRLKFDGDSDVFFEQDIEQHLADAHLTAVEAGQQVRQGLLAMFRDILNIS